MGDVLSMVYEWCQDHVWQILLFCFGVLVGAALLYLILYVRHWRDERRAQRRQEGSRGTRTRPSVPNPSGGSSRPHINSTTSNLHGTKGGAFSSRPVLEPKNLQAPDPEVSYSVEAEPEVVEPIPQTPKELYFPAPRWDGSFETRNGRAAYKDGESMYKAVILSPSEAKFELLNQRIVLNKALNTPDACLDPVCDGNRQYGRDYQAIVTDVPGTLRLEGDVWVLVSKAQISYR